MADALCGPSNALQRFQKHASADRTLQQDRLVGGHAPSQGFRSSSGPPASLDAEFDAFQAGQAMPLLQLSHGFPHLSPSQSAHLQPQLVQPDWASDFQRLNIGSTQTTPLAQQHRPPIPNTPPSWHQEFMEQQATSVQTSPPHQQQQNAFSGMRTGMAGFAQSCYSPGVAFAGLNMNGDFSAMTNVSTGVAQGKQKVSEQVPQFEEAAFEEAFAQAQQDMNEEDHRSRMNDVEKLHRSAKAQAVADEELQEPVLQRLREQRPGVYAALRIRNAIDTGQIADTERYFDFMENLEESSTLIQDASEGQWIVDTLRKVAAQGYSPRSTMRAEHLVKAVNERLMSTYPLHSSTVSKDSAEIWREVEALGYTRNPVPRQTGQQPEISRQESAPLSHANDEMAETAGQLLERVADNKSSKFQNSQFLQLMRRLRDREVRVEGDKMVEVSEASTSPSFQHALSTQSMSSSASATTSIPPVDPHILNHAATDFAMPVSSSPEDNPEYALTPDQTDYMPIFDEITGQFNHYNIKATYHKTRGTFLHETSPARENRNPNL